MIRVSLVEDHRATRETLLRLLRHMPNVVCVGAYSNAEQAVREIPSLVPHIVLMDINLPAQSGIECVAKLKWQLPEVQFVMLTTYAEVDQIFKALRAGATGYLLKKAASKELGPALLEVSQGGAPMSMEIARRLVSHFHQIPKAGEEDIQFSPRELDILEHLSKGLAYKQIADELGISVHTVHTHLRRIYRKLHVQSRTEAVMKFIQQH